MAVITTASPGTLWVGTAGNTASVSATSWQAWNQAWYQLGATATTSTAWVQWNTTYFDPDRLIVNYGAPEPETGEQRAERERAAALAREEAERLARERAAVRSRADELLVALLSAEQEQTWREHDWFTVRGSRSGRAYRIRRGYAGNVDQLDEAGLAEVTYCAHPPDVPPEDADIAQMLALVTDEDAFLAVANATPRHRLRVAGGRAAEPAQQLQAAA